MDYHDGIFLDKQVDIKRSERRNRLPGVIAVAAVVLATANDTATDFGNESGADVLTGNGGGIF